MLDPKTKSIFRIVILILFLSTLAIGGTMLGFVFSGAEMPYFFQHFGLAICLFLIGIIAFMLPMLNQTKYTGDSKDSMMLVVAVLLILSAILSIIISYINFNFS